MTSKRRETLPDQKRSTRGPNGPRFGKSPAGLLSWRVGAASLATGLDSALLTGKLRSQIWIQPEKSPSHRLTYRWGWIPSWNGGRYQSGEITPASATPTCPTRGPSPGGRSLPGPSHGLDPKFTSRHRSDAGHYPVSLIRIHPPPCSRAGLAGPLSPAS
jgi:hypothetical protein